MRTEQATVYRLSNTLTLIVTEAGRVSLQRNLREPIELNPSEARNLSEVVNSQRATVRGPEPVKPAPWHSPGVPAAGGRRRRQGAD